MFKFLSSEIAYTKTSKNQMLLFKPSLTTKTGMCSDKPVGAFLSNVRWQNVSLYDNL